jgi:SAM-dependent methyltransferase
VSWDPVWETAFRSRAWGRYPPEELIRFIAPRFYGAPDRAAVRILELGCGPGANLWYLAREGFAAAGIDGSSTAIGQAAERLALESLDAELVVGDFTNLRDYFEPASVDAVIDIAAIQHNRRDAARAVLQGAVEVLKAGAPIFSMLVAAGSWGDGLGREIEPRTFVDIASGPLAGAGVTRFATREDVDDLFAPFEGLSVDYAERTLEGGRRTYRHWIVTATRPG